MSHLDDLAFEKVLLDAPPAGATEHLASCEGCRARLTELRAQGADFKQYVFPSTVDAIVAAASPRPWWRLIVLPVALAAAAALTFVLWPLGPKDEYVGIKGGTVGLAVFSLDAQGAAVRLDDGARVSASASLRFQVRPDAPCHLWLLSVDEQGTVSRLFPAEGGPLEVSGETTLPGGAELDGVAGAERLFAVCTPSPVGFDEVARAASTARVSLRETHALPLDARQGSVLLEKSP